MTFTILSITAFTISLIASSLIKRFAISKNIVDDPAKSERKVHNKKIPLMGGVGIYLAFVIAMIVAMFLGALPEGSIMAKHIVGLLIGGLWLVIGGVLDDIYDFPPKKQIIWPILAVITIIISGIGIESLTNPIGGQLFLDQWDIIIFWWQGVPYKITLMADLFTFVWLLGVIYAIKFFDGLDGLVSGITIIGSLVIFFTSLLPKINQSETALVALIVAAAFAGFLVLNFNPAKMFLGESGSLLAGFLVGSLAIIAESKVVTTLVVMALPILDLVWVIVRRMIIEKKSPVQADRKHIHHRLLDIGFSHRNAVLILYAWAIVLGLFAWLLQAYNQGYVLVIGVAGVVAFGWYVVKRRKSRERR